MEKNISISNKDLNLTIDNPYNINDIIDFLKKNNTIQSIKIENYNNINDNLEKNIKEMYLVNITLQNFKINGVEQITCNLNRNIWTQYKKFNKENNINEDRINISIPNLKNFLTFLEKNKINNIETIPKIKKKIIQLKKDEIFNNGIGSILSNLKFLYFMKQNTQEDLDKKLILVE